MAKSIPLRKCVVTREQLPKQELLRIVKSKDGIIEVDLTGKKNGRGAYVTRSEAVIKKAKKTKAIERSLGIAITDEFYDILLGYVT